MKENIDKSHENFTIKKKTKKKKQKMKEHTKIIISFFFLLCVVLLAWIFYGKRQPQEISNTTTRQEYVNSESIHDNGETTKETIIKFFQQIRKEGENDNKIVEEEAAEELRPIIIGMFNRLILLYESALQNFRFWGEDTTDRFDMVDIIRKILETRKTEIENETNKILLLEANLFLTRTHWYLEIMVFEILENYGKTQNEK